MTIQSIIISALNIVAVLGILAYPGTFLAGMMALSAPKSTSNASNLLIAFGSVTYPLFIFLLVYLSQRYQSYILAMLATVPFFFLLWVFVVDNILAYKATYHNTKKDFVYSENAFLFIDDTIGNSRAVMLHEKLGLMTYHSQLIGSIYKDQLFSPYFYDLVPAFQAKCMKYLREGKNEKGEAFLEKYRLIDPKLKKEQLDLLVNE